MSLIAPEFAGVAQIQEQQSAVPGGVVQGVASNAGVQCDVTFENALCLRNGEYVIMPPARAEGLVARYLFDSGHAVDVSGHGYHGSGVVTPGPSPFGGGSGYSARLGKNTLVQIPGLAIGSATTHEWAYSFWLYLIKDTADKAQDSYCPLIESGDGEAVTGVEAGHSYLSIALNGQSRGLRVSVASSHGLEFFDLHAHLALQVWYRVAVTRQNNRVVAYVNGVRDAFLDFKGDVLDADSVADGLTSLRLGSNDCLAFLVDDLVVWNQLPGSLYIEAEAAMALGNLEPAAFELACVQCTKTEAEEGCSDQYHLCGDWELNGGVLQAVRQLGWLQLGFKVHSAGAARGIVIQTADDATPTDTPTDSGVGGLGICCRD
ncbi:concanavalin A-like lectin/glucanase family protein [Gregarina niphandrodes]|uniref:Concanavalin A-like lectin/glucanase family protein n=1 Tax=Gregarina niphandrodes TaxID=110365 RepID=A0A023BCM7_GRENI|nr:concanavalin A-like lectin/glucanase family protein [Gregarina niphandrodes]EZG83074.1 concanavalin A-like lectin/glucanase family protein [Gregarina niphandrodes]|eukprot:XP_011128955.1 concanavalin A-like lectin/glucanase family protein [Gregarina niphandrodes]